MKPSQTPQALGYRFPAEWEPQEAIWFAWPVRRSLWPDCFDRVRAQLAELYMLAARFQMVRVLCAASEQVSLRALLAEYGDPSTVQLDDYQTDDVWIRDYGPLFLVNDQDGGIAIADWRFNAWGNKFPDQAKDDGASLWIARLLELPCFSTDRVLEGGAVESNGAGDLLTTEAVLLNPTRNGVTTVAQVEAELRADLCVERVLWLGEGLVGDDTDGHIDNLARFFKADGILIAEAGTQDNPSAPALEENLKRAEAFRTQSGAPLTIVKLPVPAVMTNAGEPLAASYLNFVVLNGAVLVPTYGQPSNDATAIEILGACFPDREIIGFDCVDIIKEGGALHCMSQHQPRAMSGN